MARKSRKNTGKKPGFRASNSSKRDERLPKTLITSTRKGDKENIYRKTSKKALFSRI